MEAKQTPLIELLVRVPQDARLIVEHDQHSSSSYPVGRLCHEAATALRAALAERPAEQAPVAWMCSNTELMHKGYQMFSATGGGDWNIPLYTAPQPAKPPGYKLVPVEPTDEMLEMGQWLEYPESGSRMQPVRMEDVRGVWKAMLNAAPEAPAQEKSNG